MTLAHRQAADVESRMAGWVAGLTLSDIPQSALAIAKSCMGDGLGVMLAGSITTIHAQAAGLARPAGDCFVAGSSAGTDARSAAFLNGTAGHILDFDDTSYTGIVHGTAVVLPAVLAMAQEVDASGAQLLAGFVAGVETEYALGLALTDSLYERGCWTTATLGVIGAAAGAAKLLRLAPDAVAHAIRLAANMPLGLRATHGSSGKPYLCGMAARLGVEAALAAAAGIQGQAGTFERRRGFAHALNDGTFHSAAIDALGKRYALIDPGIAFKLRPMCSATQAAIEAVIVLREQHGLDAAEIASVVCHGTALVTTSLPYRSPAQPSEAQFCMPFAIACTLLHGDVRLDHLDPETLEDPALRDLMERVELREDATLVPPEEIVDCPEAARVEIRLTDGRHLTHTVLAATGMPQRPASQRVLFDKFMDCAARTMDAERARALWGRLQHIEQLPVVRRLFDDTAAARRA